MIDFRYHLVSLIAVFLAVALGIIIGTTALNQPILANVKGQVSSLERDKRTLEARTQDLQAQVKAEGTFDQAVAPALVKGTLTGHRVLLVVGGDDVPGSTVDQVTALLQRAGATLSGTLRLQSGYSDPNNGTKLQNYLATGVPAGVALPAGNDPAQIVAALLAGVLMAPAQHGGGSTQTAAISSVLAGLSALDLVSADTPTVTPADFAVVLAAGTQTDKDAAQRNAALVDLAAALDAAGSGAVVAGDTASATTGGLVAAVRNSPTVSTRVSTVDNADVAAGQISTVLALGQERQGISGAYGTQPNTQPVPPVPGATP